MDNVVIIEEKTKNITLKKDSYLRDPDYRAFIREQYCIFCYYRDRIKNYQTMFCHAYAGGMGIKCSDEFGFPGCTHCHSGFDGRLGPTRKEFMKDYPGIDLKAIMLEFRKAYDPIS